MLLSNFSITPGMFITFKDVYGALLLYEHGDKIKNKIIKTTSLNMFP